VLHVHSDAEAIRHIFELDPDTKVIWAHAGFEYAYIVRDLLDKYPGLWADLAFRREIFNNQRFLPDWQSLLIEHADRFMLGVDTYEPQRWLMIKSVIHWQRQFLAALPDEVARKIAFENAQRITQDFK